MENLSSLVMFVFVAAFTPGPNNIMIMASGLNHGYRASMPHFFGICFGFPVMVLAIGFGLGLIFTQYPWVYQLMKLCGIAYLIYLAWLIANSGSAGADNKKAKPFTFFQAAMFQWINPKAWIMASSALATYTDSSDSFYLQILIVATVFFSFTFPSAGVWMVFGRKLNAVLNKPKQLVVFNWSMAILLVLSILPAATSLFK